MPVPIKMPNRSWLMDGLCRSNGGPDPARGLVGVEKNGWFWLAWVDVRQKENDAKTPNIHFRLARTDSSPPAKPIGKWSEMPPRQPGKQARCKVGDGDKLTGSAH